VPCDDHVSPVKGRLNLKSYPLAVRWRKAAFCKGEYCFFLALSALSCLLWKNPVSWLEGSFHCLLFFYFFSSQFLVLALLAGKCNLATSGRGARNLRSNPLTQTNPAFELSFVKKWLYQIDVWWCNQVRKLIGTIIVFLTFSVTFVVLYLKYGFLLLNRCLLPTYRQVQGRPSLLQWQRESSLFLDGTSYCILLF